MSSRRRAPRSGVLPPPPRLTPPGPAGPKTSIISFQLRFYCGVSSSFLGGESTPPPQVLVWSYMTESLAKPAPSGAPRISPSFCLPTSSPPTIFTLKASHCHLREGRFWNRFPAPCGGRKKKETQTENGVLESRVPPVNHRTRLRSIRLVILFTFQGGFTRWLSQIKDV